MYCRIETKAFLRVSDEISRYLQLLMLCHKPRQSLPVKGGRRLWLPLHVRSVEVHVVKSSSYPIFSVPLEAVDQRPGCVSDNVHSVYDNRFMANDRQTHGLSWTSPFGEGEEKRSGSPCCCCAVPVHSHFSASAMNLLR